MFAATNQSLEASAGRDFLLRADGRLAAGPRVPRANVGGVCVARHVTFFRPACRRRRTTARPAECDALTRELTDRSGQSVSLALQPVPGVAQLDLPRRARRPPSSTICSTSRQQHRLLRSAADAMFYEALGAAGRMGPPPSRAGPRTSCGSASAWAAGGVAEGRRARADAQPVIRLTPAGAWGYFTYRKVNGGT
jgi:hypothetical protein